MKINKILFLAILLPALAACERGDRDDRVKVAGGDSFTIELKANWSTGYHWKWTNRDEVTIADTTGLEYIEDDPGQGGTAGTEIWSFRAMNKGEERLEFVYQPPGATGNEGEDTREIDLLVY
jgi:predicted secreted protein